MIRSKFKSAIIAMPVASHSCQLCVLVARMIDF